MWDRLHASIHSISRASGASHAGPYQSRNSQAGALFIHLVKHGFFCLFLIPQEVKVLQNAKHLLLSRFNTDSLELFSTFPLQHVLVLVPLFKQASLCAFFNAENYLKRCLAVLVKTPTARRARQGGEAGGRGEEQESKVKKEGEKNAKYTEQQLKRPVNIPLDCSKIKSSCRQIVSICSPSRCSQ